MIGAKPPRTRHSGCDSAIFIASALIRNLEHPSKSAAKILYLHRTVDDAAPLTGKLAETEWASQGAMTRAGCRVGIPRRVS